MKVIDKTSTAKQSKYNYGDVIKCWNDDRDNYVLYQIVTSKHFTTGRYQLRDFKDMIFSSRLSGENSDYIEDLIEKIRESYKHFKKVKAVLTIYDLDSEEEE